MRYRILALPVVSILLPLLCSPDASLALPKNQIAWSADTINAALSPENRRGRNVAYSQMPFKATVGVSRQALDDDSIAPPRSGYEDDGGSVSGNFQLAVPIVSLPGRGINLNLTMYYNSLIWYTAEGKRVFNPDADWPAPGWSLGFGKLTKVVLIDPDGTRHPLQSVEDHEPPPDPDDPLRPVHRRTTDATLIDIQEQPCSPDLCVSIVRYPNGTTVEFSGSVAGNAARYPTKIIDRNGNFISISYMSPLWNWQPALSSIVDSVGRTIQFLYDDKENLIAIRGPTSEVRLNYCLDTGDRVQVTEWDADAHTYRKRWEERAGLGYLIQAIYYTANDTGFLLNGCDGHERLYTVRWQTGMKLSEASDTGQGTISPGTTIRTRRYTYSPDSSAAAPQISQIAETWTGNPDPAVTLIDIRHDQQLREVTITYPDGSQNLQIADESPGRIDSGLVYLSVVKSRNGTILSTQLTSWEAGLDNMPRVHSVMTQNGGGLATTTVFEYGLKNEITAINSFGFDGSLIRRKTTTYVTDPRYDAQYLYNLPVSTQVFSGAEVNPISRTDFAYDESSLDDAPGVRQHLPDFDPYHPPPSGYQHAVRGNLTSTTSYADAPNAKSPISVNNRYDITGNLVSAVRWAGAETRYTYSLGTQFAFPDFVTRGSTDPASNVRVISQYTYDMDRGLPLTYVDANGLKTTFHYNTAGDLDNIDREGGPVTKLNNDHVNLQRSRETYDHAGSLITQSLSQLDGRSQIIRSESLSANGGKNVRQFKYDFSGQRIGETLAYAANSTDLQWITYSYDALGRPTTKAAPDGGVTHRYYDEAQRPPAADRLQGSSVRTQDPWGRERWWLADSMGRIVEVVEPDPHNTGSLLNGSGFLTKYSYDVLGNLTRVDQGAQAREYSFDSLSRLIAQRVPEQSTTLSDTGRYVTDTVARKWSEVRSYDERTGNLLPSRTRAEFAKRLVTEPTHWDGSNR